jgi:hypothetical protein
MTTWTEDRAMGGRTVLIKGDYILDSLAVFH